MPVRRFDLDQRFTRFYEQRESKQRQRELREGICLRRTKRAGRSDNEGESERLPSLRTGKNTGKICEGHRVGGLFCCWIDQKSGDFRQNALSAEQGTSALETERKQGNGLGRTGKIGFVS